MRRADQNNLAPMEPSLVESITLVRPRRNPKPELVAPATGKAGVKWIWALPVFLIAAALTFLAIYIAASRSNGDLPLPRSVQAFLPDASLGLRVEYQGEHLLVTWDRRSPVVRAAVAGVLRIEDGSQRRDVRLDAELIAGGSILYKPASDDVIFRLELRNAQGNATVESMRVLTSVTTPPANSPATEKPNSTRTPDGIAAPKTP